MDKIRFSEQINKLRLKRKMTQGELGEMLGVSNKTVSKWEMGISLPEIDTLVKITEIFDISLEELVLNKENKRIVTDEMEEQIKKEKKKERNSEPFKIVKVILNAVSLAMGVGVLVTSFLDEIGSDSALVMLSIGLITNSLTLLMQNQNN